MMKKIFFSCFIVLLSAFPVYAELSTNPWLEPNSEEEIAEVYAGQGYQEVSEEATKVYAKIPENSGSDSGFLAKVKNVFKSESEENQNAPVKISVGETNQSKQMMARRRSMSGRKKSAHRRAANSTDEGGGLMDGLNMPSADLSGVVDAVKGFNLKSLSNVFK